MNISTAKTKVLAFQGKSPVKAKTVINDELVEQISMFKWDIIYILTILMTFNMKLSNF
jgi:hypothetical protein